MCTLFASWGCHVAGAADARTVVSALDRGTPDLIVADLRLAHGQSGIEVIGELRRSFGLAIPAVIVSGDTSDAAREETRVAGIALLTKPVVAAALRATAEALIAHHGNSILPPLHATMPIVNVASC